MEQPILLCNGPRLVKRVIFEADGGATLQHLTVTQEVSLTAAQLDTLVECLPFNRVSPASDDRIPSEDFSGVRFTPEGIAPARFIKPKERKENDDAF